MKRLASNLTVQVLTAIALGVLLGALAPDVGKAMRVTNAPVSFRRVTVAPFASASCFTVHSPSP